VRLLRSIPGPQRLPIAIAVALIVIGIYMVVQHRGKAADEAAIAKLVGARRCDDSGYRLGEARATIHNCAMASGQKVCVTETNGVARNSTVAVRREFSRSPPAAKPDCAT
jgi:hypothetical protein